MMMISYSGVSARGFMVMVKVRRNLPRDFVFFRPPGPPPSLCFGGVVAVRTSGRRATSVIEKSRRISDVCRRSRVSELAVSFSGRRDAPGWRRCLTTIPQGRPPNQAWQARGGGPARGDPCAPAQRPRPALPRVHGHRRGQRGDREEPAPEAGSATRPRKNSGAECPTRWAKMTEGKDTSPAKDAARPWRNGVIPCASQFRGQSPKGHQRRRRSQLAVSSVVRPTPIGPDFTMA